MFDDLMSGMSGGAPSFKSSSSAPSANRQGDLSLSFDNSGWTTATGGSKAGAGVPWYVLAGLAVMAIFVVKKLK